MYKHNNIDILFKNGVRMTAKFSTLKKWLRVFNPKTMECITSADTGEVFIHSNNDYSVWMHTDALNILRT